ncbi:lipopolysaccharide biosynthesis protein [Pseudoroseomonas globiformis]|uniref:Lipopolysaccharide biosynthesis protein n=1 Tax=Teichococcus globiformis TaxID=2307229 RepID=A0ABV7FWG8_9PROT
MRALSALLGGTVAASLLAVSAQMVLARSLTAADYGRFAALLAAASLVTPVASAGVNWFLVQAFGAEGEAARRWLRPLGRVLLMAGVAAALLFSVYALLGSSAEPWQRSWILLGGLAMLAGQAAAELASARLQIEERFSTLALWQCVTQAMRMGLLLVFVLSSSSAISLEAVILLYAATGCVVTVVGIWLMVPLWHGGGLRLRNRNVAAGAERMACISPSLRMTLAQAAPFALMTIFYVVYFQWAVVLLDWQLGGAAAGAYNAALLLIAAASMLPQVIYMKFLTPIIARWSVHDRPRFGALLHLGVIGMFCSGAAGCIVLVLGGPWIIPALFGPSLAEAVPILAILALGLPVRFVQASYSASFVTPREVACKVRYLGVAAACGVTANLLLVPLQGAEGAAWAALLSEVVLLALHVHGTHRTIEGVSILDTFSPATPRRALRLLMGGRHAG